jgi:signal transduction histidine kinase
VISNPLSNASKYTPNGGAIRVASGLKAAQAVITVADTGIGIPPEGIATVFDLFSQVREHQGHSEGGLGIGLALVKQLVSMHGGTVAAHSDGLGAGSIFEVRLPLSAG